MRIKENNRDVDVEVYGIYWAEYQGKLQRFHFVIPYQGYEGLNAVPEVECEVTDAAISSQFRIVKNSRGNDLIIHETLLEDNLLDELIEHDPEAMKEFQRRLSKTIE
ncbi:MAG: hypothetical protein ABW116_04125 [Candidatus Sedimenticola sp. 20ELBAFRAG]